MYDMSNERAFGQGDTLGGRISLARAAKGISVEDAANLNDVDPDVWTTWENDRDAPATHLLETVALTLDVSLLWLLDGRGFGPMWRREA
ncbi:transcriptional regulator (plasmid) [Neorhizobium sp. SOG26]|uniref:helix-turn-helix domain-containing protein n=1 Tax=Neorhizobium sp. SOG26 TaxID=2060726 RepID=UPI000E56AE96|nr:helix-turn-helix transcriptional regulator [Neorhizobium sp. SOG26]AXV18189.1 transcriptional regulator [Neorhizobium sp. SOG26]